MQRRDEAFELAGRAPAAARATGTATLEPRRQPQNVSDHLLSLQRSYGNAAVTTVVQRKERPASTDAPWYKPPPKQPAAEEYWPEKQNASLTRFPDTMLTRMAEFRLKSDDPNEWKKAATIYEEYWFRHQTYRPAALPLYRVYKRLGDDKRAQFWLGVLQGRIKPGAKNDQIQDEDDQTGKMF